MIVARHTKRPDRFRSERPRDDTLLPPIFRLKHIPIARGIAELETP